jgi:hypothetical protein
MLKMKYLSYLDCFLQALIAIQYNCSYSPDRADILWALGRLLDCPQIKARAGKWFIEMPKPVASDIKNRFIGFLFF